MLGGDYMFTGIIEELGVIQEIKKVANLQNY